MADATATSHSAKTKVKKLFVEPKPPAGQLLVIKYEGGGEVPDELKGSFTRWEVAEAAIANYEKRKKK